MTQSLPSRYRIPILAGAAGLGLILALWLLRQALTPFFLAMVLAYLLAPAVAHLSRWMKRGKAVVAVTLGFVAAVGAALWLVIPYLLTQLDRLVSSIPQWKSGLEAKWGPWLEAHPWIKARLLQGMEGLDPMIVVKGAWGAGMDLLAGFLHAMSYLLVPLIVYYLLVEGPELLVTVDSLIPPRYRARIRRLMGAIHVRLGGYIRGQIAVTLAMAILQGIAFQVVGVPSAWLLGLIAGISNVVPYSPYLTALAPALIIAGLGGAGWGHLLLIALVFTGVQKIEAFYLTPVWVGRASKLHPLEVLVAILCFGFAFGIVGLILAIPLMIVVKVVLEMLIEDYKHHPWFEEATPQEPAP